MIFRRWRLPDWSAFEDRRTHEAFVAAVHEQLREADLPIADREGGRLLDLGEGATLDLADVGVDAAGLPPEAWPDLVRGRIASATNPYRAPSAPELLRPAVRVRLMAEDDRARFPKELPHRRHADLAEVLVIAARGGVTWAGEDDLAPLGVALDELFEIGRANVRSTEEVVATSVAVGGGAVTRIEAAHDYVASWAPMVDELVEAPPAGVVVAVPTRGLLLARPLDGTEDDVLDAMATMAAERFELGPGRISQRLYLWRDGELTAHT